MADIKSPSYLRDKEAAYNWLKRTKAGDFAVGILRQHAEAAGVSLSNILEDREKWVDWEDLVKEQRNGLAIAANCAEARASYDLAKNAKSSMGPPIMGPAKWTKIFTPPTWYTLRKQVEVADPHYWNDPKNVLREALKNPQWATVPADMIRGELENHLKAPKKREQCTEGSPPSSSPPDQSILSSE